VSVHVLRFDQLDSTSLQARRLVASGELPPQSHLVLAARQTGGIGRHGRPWSSPFGGLWMTLLWPLPESAGPYAGGRLPETLSLQLGLAVQRVLARAMGPNFSIRCKWPNDVMANDRKLAGMLIETASGPTRLPTSPLSTSTRWVLVGIGCNINNPVSTLHPEVQAAAASAISLTGEPIELEIFRKRLVASVLGVLHEPASDEAACAAFAEVMWGIGRTVSATLPDGSTRQGTIRGIDAQGRLLLGAGSPERVEPLASISQYVPHGQGG
jgi:BirA family transcriptional regulator, biotin operon repressor / biotin---[acetyl-CoA-carboxylase] ligase